MLLQLLMFILKNMIEHFASKNTNMVQIMFHLTKLFFGVILEFQPIRQQSQCNL
jgi:hypothetical protein